MNHQEAYARHLRRTLRQQFSARSLLDPAQCRFRESPIIPPKVDPAKTQRISRAKI